MPYDPTRPHTPRERYEQLEADRAAAERVKTEDERLLEAWASYSDREVLAAVRAGNQKHSDKELRKRVARLRGLMPPQTEAERQAIAQRAAELAELGIEEDEDFPRIAPRRRRS